jgi:hypothetical protein
MATTTSSAEYDEYQKESFVILKPSGSLAGYSLFITRFHRSQQPDFVHILLMV